MILSSFGNFANVVIELGREVKIKQLNITDKAGSQETVELL